MQRAHGPFFTVVAEGASWLAVDKAPFVAAHPKKPGGAKTLWESLRELLAFELANGGQVSVINRLDRETSGLTLIAKNAAAARHFHEAFARREVEKEYLALVWGWPQEERFTVEAPILRQGEKGATAIYLKRCVHPEGARAVTHFRVERRFEKTTSNGGRFALVRAFPQTGRTHQIRVHLAHAGFPIVGDKIYGPDERAYLEFIQTGWTSALEASLLLPRHALHCARLRLAGPDGEPLEWASPLPADLAAWMG